MRIPGFFKRTSKDSEVEKDSNIFRMPLFGVIELQNLKDYYGAILKTKKNSIQLDLNFDNTTISEKELRQTSEFIQNLHLKIEQTTRIIKEDFDNGEGVSLYLDHHLESFTESEISELLKDSRKQLSQKEELFKLLTLNRICINPENDIEYAIFDYTISKELTDYLLVVKLNSKDELEEITMES